MPDLFKEIIPSIMVNKRNCIVSEADEKSYVPFVVNKALSFHFDCVMRANEMNMNYGVDAKLQYSYMLNTVRGYKRPFVAWYKRKTEENIELVKEYYGYSNTKAKEALRILSEAQLSEIKNLLNKGGNNDTQLERSGVGKASR